MKKPRPGANRAGLFHVSRHQATLIVFWALSVWP